MPNNLIKNEALLPGVFLAPMAGITDLPFRDLVSEFGAGLVVSEMIASHELVQKKPSTLARAELGFGREKTAVQIAGREAQWMSVCAKICQDQGAKIIDINMGCPAKKVTNGYSGSALMKEPDHALRLIEAVVAAVDIPVTLKMRLGWDHDMLNAPYLGKRAEEAGVQMITVHGRTRCQFYKGHADWVAIKPVKEAISIPLVANGDIVDVTSARQAMALSGADAVMIGRGIQGRPWMAAEIASELFQTPKPNIPTGADLLAMITSHYESVLSFYGEVLGNRVARKHLGWYMDDLEISAQQRKALLVEKSAKGVLDRIADLPTTPRQRPMVGAS